MKKVAVFGKPANGKSTLSKKLAAATGIKLYPLDAILYGPNGEEIDGQVFDAAHEDILAREEWIIEGFGPRRSLQAFNRRLEQADTLIYIDLPYLTSYWLVTKRLIKGVFATPQGWPEGSSIVKGTLDSYRTLRLCPKFWNDDFLRRLEKQAADKNLHVIRSISELDGFVGKQVR